VGVDIIELDRVAAALKRHGGRFWSASTRRSRRRLPRPLAELAARFAAKEAVMKALAPAPRRGLAEIEVLPNRAASRWSTCTAAPANGRRASASTG